MNCQDMQELLSGYADGQVDGREKRLVERHLEGCAVCRRGLRLAEAIKSAMGALPQPALPADLKENLRRKMDRRPILRYSLLGALAAALFAAARLVSWRD